MIASLALSTAIMLNSPEKGELRICSYNVLVGFSGSGGEGLGFTADGTSIRQQKTGEWLAWFKPDIVGFQELNGWTVERLAEFSKTWGHGHAALVKEDGYIVGLTSRWPIEVKERVREGMWHGLLWAETGGFQVLTAHWSPSDSAFRFKEATTTLAKFNEAKKTGMPVIAMGDFNNPSPLDADLLAKSRFVNDEGGVRKWASDGRGQPYYGPISVLMNGGMHDTWSVKRPADAFNRYHGANWPRIDYIWTTDDLASKLIKADMHTSLDDMKRSDHPPVTAVFRWDTGK